MQQGHDKVVAVLLENDSRGKVRLPALHIAAKKDDVKAAKLLLDVSTCAKNFCFKKNVNWAAVIALKMHLPFNLSLVTDKTKESTLTCDIMSVPVQGRLALKTLPVVCHSRGL